jgi:hypothetical protein
MATTITETRMSSDVTEHHASKIPAHPPGELWRVSWLPGRVLARNQAVTAMVVAEHVARGVRDGSHKKWPFMLTWARELGVSAEDAVRDASGPVTVEMSSDCACGRGGQCPFPRSADRDSRQWSDFTAADWVAFHRRAAHYFDASVQVHKVAGDAPPEMLAAWCLAIMLHLRMADVHFGVAVGTTGSIPS